MLVRVLRRRTALPQQESELCCTVHPGDRYKSHSAKGFSLWAVEAESLVPKQRISTYVGNLHMTLPLTRTQMMLGRVDYVGCSVWLRSIMWIR